MRRLAIIGLAVLALSACGDETTSTYSSTSSPSGITDGVAGCVDRGLAYFREIDAFPKLSDGRLAADVAAERCSRTTTAF